MPSMRPRGRASEHDPAPGQALAEFALVLPILAIILLGIVQLAFIFGAQIGVTNAVREAARLAATTTPTVSFAEAQAHGPAVYGRLKADYLPDNVWAFDPAGLVEAGAGDTRICYTAVIDTATKDAVNVKVEAIYRHTIFIPLLGPLLDEIDGVADGGLRIGAAEEMRVENPELLAAPGFGTLCYDP